MAPLKSFCVLEENIDLIVELARLDSNMTIMIDALDKCELKPHHRLSETQQNQQRDSRFGGSIHLKLGRKGHETTLRRNWESVY